MPADDGTPASWQELVLAQLDERGAPTFVQVSPEAQVYVTRSESDPMEVYYLIVLPWIVVCTCKGFRFRSDCKHSRGYLDGQKLTVVR